MSIREVGQGGPTASDYVVLQMYASGQNHVAGKQIRTYDETGALRSTVTFPTDVPFGDSQRTIYVSRSGGTPPTPPDFTTSEPDDLILTNEGAVCFGAAFGPGQAVDCVSYGSFAGVPGGNPSPMGASAPAPDGGQAIRRTIAPGCATLLEAGDDSDDSATDFAVTEQAPRNNSTAPTETACSTGGGGGTTDQVAPETTLTKRPKRKLDRSKTKVKFTSNEPGSTFECKFDKKPWKACTSPRKLKRLKDGRHKFRVRATDAAGNTDLTPAKAKFKVVD